MNFIEFVKDFRENVKSLVDKGIDYLQLKIDEVDTTVIANTLTNYIFNNLSIPFFLKPFKGFIEKNIKNIVEERLEEIKDLILGV